MLRAYFSSNKKCKREPHTYYDNKKSLQQVFSLVLPFLQWPERLACKRVCKTWRGILENTSIERETQCQMLQCFHVHWYTVRVRLPRFQSAFVPNGYQQMLFSAHHPQCIAIDHICGRALVIPGSARGYKETIQRHLGKNNGDGVKTNVCSVDGTQSLEIDTFSVCISKKGLLLLTLPLQYDSAWKPMEVLHTINSVVHTKMPTMLVKKEGVCHYEQPDLKDAMLSFCCPCYLRYLAMSGFFWPHTRKDFKFITK